MGRRERDSNPIWNYYDKCLNKKAKCRICSNLYSYASTTHNLLMHLERKHETVLKGGSNEEQFRDTNERIWEYFIKTLKTGHASCKICENICPFSHTDTLVSHLKEEHLDEFNEYMNTSEEDQVLVEKGR